MNTRYAPPSASADESPAKKPDNPTTKDIAAYMPLVQRIASQLMARLPRSVQREDLVAAGTVGLFDALRSTSHTSLAMFEAYARIRIRGSMVDELRRHDWSPRRRKETSGALASNDVSAVGGGSDALTLRPTIAVIGFGDLPAGCEDKFAGNSASPLDNVLERREHEELRAAVDELPEREREIVRLRYFDGIPCKAIAVTMGLSEARVSQLHSRATSRLKGLLLDSVLAKVKVAA